MGHLCKDFLRLKCPVDSVAIQTEFHSIRFKCHDCAFLCCANIDLMAHNCKFEFRIVGSGASFEVVPLQKMDPFQTLPSTIIQNWSRWNAGSIWTRPSNITSHICYSRLFWNAETFHTLNLRQNSAMFYPSYQWIWWQDSFSL